MPGLFIRDGILKAQTLMGINAYLETSLYKKNYEDHKIKQISWQPQSVFLYSS